MTTTTQKGRASLGEVPQSRRSRSDCPTATRTAGASVVLVTPAPTPVPFDVVEERVHDRETLLGACAQVVDVQARAWAYSSRHREDIIQDSCVIAQSKMKRAESACPRAEALVPEGLVYWIVRGVMRHRSQGDGRYVTTESGQGREVLMAKGTVAGTLQREAPTDPTADIALAPNPETCPADLTDEIANLVEKRAEKGQGIGGLVTFAYRLPHPRGRTASARSREVAARILHHFADHLDAHAAAKLWRHHGDSPLATVFAAHRSGDRDLVISVLQRLDRHQADQFLRSILEDRAAGMNYRARPASAA